MSLLEDATRLAPNLSRGIVLVYILELRSQTLYVGCTSDAKVRFAKHEEGTACRTTRIDPPIAVRWVEIQPDFTAARRREAQLKKWSQAKKRALISGDTVKVKLLSRSRDLG